MTYLPLPKSFFDRDPALVAPELLGALLVRRVMGHCLVGQIVETEAYLPFNDAAAHNFKGRTKRNASLYKAAGHAYVYAMRHHHLVNVVTEGQDRPGAVLIRAVEPLIGIEYMTELRGGLEPHQLASGPGKLCAAFNINLQLDGINLTDADNALFLAEDTITGKKLLAERITSSGRIGISKATELPLRFYLRDNRNVSRYKLNQK